MKSADDVKRQFFTLGGPGIAVAIFACLTLFTTYGIVGKPFFNAYSYLWETGQSPVGLPPYYIAFFMILLKDQPIIIILTLIAYSLMNIVIWIPNLYIPPSRYMFAWSFDRIFPAKIAELKGKTHVPVYAFLTMYFATIIVLLLFEYTPFGGFTTSIGLAAGIMSLGLAFVAVVLPYKKKELWESSPAALYKIGKTPLMVILGAISIVYLLVMIIEYIVNPVYGLNTPLALGFLLALYVASYGFYFAFKWYRQKRGIDISKVYGEIPSA
jgi:amino acid transporter